MDKKTLTAMLEQGGPAVVPEAILALQAQIEELRATPGQSSESSNPPPDVPEHPYGLCNDRECPSCATQAQDIADGAVKAAMEDLTAALVYANGEVAAQDVTAAYQRWVADGKPSPYLSIEGA